MLDVSHTVRDNQHAHSVAVKCFFFLYKSRKSSGIKTTLTPVVTSDAEADYMARNLEFRFMF